ncbi:hypothetical protein EH223_07110 [candidate division KSB1 bacterium]|nr:MAG: hypothetical protein EH223_07110 [candidate division KSB1 bacterium]
MKIEWQGKLIGVQPRIRLTRSFDQRQHSYLGYVLFVDGFVDGKPDQFLVGIGKGAQAKHLFQAGDDISGLCEPVIDPDMDPADFYKACKLKVISRGRPSSPPPWTDLAVDLEIYRERGHRRLSTATYNMHCRPCKWGCRMAVEMIIDQWNPGKRRFRTETFCYGPKSCALYKAGATRKVPGRKGMTWEEEDWIDEEETAHRGPDD